MDDDGFHWKKNYATPLKKEEESTSHDTYDEMPKLNNMSDIFDDELFEHTNTWLAVDVSPEKRKSEINETDETDEQKAERFNKLFFSAKSVEKKPPEKKRKYTKRKLDLDSQPSSSPTQTQFSTSPGCSFMFSPNKPKTPPSPKRAILDLAYKDPAHQSLSDKLLTKRDKVQDEFINEFVKEIKKICKATSGTSADLSHQQRLEQAELSLANCSVTLAHKLRPIIQDVVAQEEARKQNNRYAVIRANPIPDKDLSANYRECFHHFVNDADAVSFVAPDKQLLKEIDIKDAFLLTFFIFNTTKRQPNDNLLQLIVSGFTSTGKSMIFESPLQEVSHTLTSDAGVGRFLNLHAKSTCLLRDCDINVLVTGKDVDKFKCITRTEAITTKVHSKTNSIPPLHFFVTSNKKLNEHKYSTPKKNSNSFSKREKTEITPSKKTSLSDIVAIQARFIECHVRQRPNIPREYIPTSGSFSHENCIVGLFRDVIKVLQRYTKIQFHSQYYYLYGIAGLAKNIRKMPVQEQEKLRQEISQLMDKYELDENQKDMAWAIEDW